MKSVFIACIVCLIASACNNNKVSTNKANTSSDTTSFYPIAAFFKSQLKHFDSLGAKYIIVTTEGAHKDSIVADGASIATLVHSFIESDISDSIQKKNYKESVFRDAGTASFNINYTPLNSSVPVRNIDILMDEQTSLIKRVFIRKQFTSKDTTSTEQLSWKTNEGFNRSISKETNNGYLLNKTITVRVILP
jgi:hypothetical protein